MKRLSKQILEQLSDQHLFEMATIASDVMLDNSHKSIQIHGTNAGDRETPHIHIYNVGDKIGFNFEVSLIDIICYDEVNLVKMTDKKHHVSINNRSKCSWDGYSRIKRNFEAWLTDRCEIPGDYKNNLDAIIYWYNRESYSREVSNPLLKYLSVRGLKVHDNYRYLFDEDDLLKYQV